MHNLSKPYQDYCQSRLGAQLSYPFDEKTAVYKVMGKMFALFSGDGLSISLKCNPTLSMALRQSYKAVTAGYHLNKVHWNTIDLNSDADEQFIRTQIDHSYQLVVQSLSKANQLLINKKK